jgi:hypothetical protein
MAYFNFQLATTKGLAPRDVILLQIIHQNKLSDHEDYLKVANLTKVKPYIKEIKGKKNQTSWQKLRLNPKGKELLELIQIPDITKGDIQMFEHLCNMYFSEETNPPRKIGNKKKVLQYISCFRNHLSLSLYEMYYLCEEYLKQEEHTIVLEYIFMKPSKTGFYSKFENNIHDSRLYQYYDENQEYIKKIWKNNIENYD